MLDAFWCIVKYPILKTKNKPINCILTSGDFFSKFSIINLFFAQDYDA